jgi:hypothetical protein
VAPIDRTSTEYRGYKSCKIIFFVALGAFLALTMFGAIARSLNMIDTRLSVLVTMIAGGVTVLAYALYALAEIKLLAPLVSHPNAGRSIRIGAWCGRLLLVSLVLTLAALIVASNLSMTEEQALLAALVIMLPAGMAVVCMAGLASAHTSLKSYYKKQEGAAHS